MLSLGALGGMLTLAVLWPGYAAGRAARGVLRDGLMELARLFPELPPGYVMLRVLVEDHRIGCCNVFLGCVHGARDYILFLLISYSISS